MPQPDPPSTSLTAGRQAQRALAGSHASDALMGAETKDENDSLHVPPSRILLCNVQILRMRSGARGAQGCMGIIHEVGHRETPPACLPICPAWTKRQTRTARRTDQAACLTHHAHGSWRRMQFTMQHAALMPPEHAWKAILVSLSHVNGAARLAVPPLGIATQ